MIVKNRNVTPATAALALRIYGHCSPGWGHTYAAAAEALGLSTQHVASVVKIMGWNDRFSVVSSGEDYALLLTRGLSSLNSSARDFLPYRRMAETVEMEEADT